MNRGDLQRLSKDELIDLVLKLQRPDKSSRTSSFPPSSDVKSDWEPPLTREERRKRSRPGGAKPGHKGHSRALCDDPDEVVDHFPQSCPHCLCRFELDAERTLLGEADEIEIPPLKPFVRRHRRFGLRCSHCRIESPAPLADEMKGTPFGSRIHALAIYLKTQHAFSYQRLSRAMADLFGLSLSEGALMNMFKRTGAAFAGQRDAAVARLRRAEVVASDETGIRIEGVGGYHWVFCCAEAVVHTTGFTRAGAVVRETMGGHQPHVWLSDRYGAQQGHGVFHQTCLAHLARNVAYAFEASDDPIPLRLRLWVNKAFDLARRFTELAPSTRAAKQRILERDIDAILATPTSCSFAQEVLARFARARDQLLTFCRFPGQVEPTNNRCERELRPAVIQRKVTNGYRAEWAAHYEADVRTAISTMRLTGADPLHAIIKTIAA